MVVAALFACSSSFTAPVASRVPCSRAASARMMFGGGGGGGDEKGPGFMEQVLQLPLRRCP